MTRLTGVILKAQSGFYTVRTGSGDYVCRLRGKLKRRRQATDLAAIGDRVEISARPDGDGAIEEVLTRHRVLSRRAPAGRGRGGRRTAEREAEQVIVANPDRVVFVFACAEPAPRMRMLDRFLVIAEAARLPALVCANKIDLVTYSEAQALFGLYPPLGYRVVYTSAVTGAGVDELRELLRGQLSVFAGPSGAGKSSLLNRLQPGLGLKARAVSEATSKGRHTTVHSELWPLDGGGFIADTPGLRALALWDVEPAELDGYFVDIRPYVAQCEFSDCTHLHEPACAVRAAVASGAISASRYDSYCRLRMGDV